MLKIVDLTVRFGQKTVLDRVHLAVATGETVALLGSSGSGKSTLLRAISGLEPLAGGSVYLNGVDITALAPNKRGIGFLFQDAQLFMHRSVAGNIAYGLECQKMPKAQRQQRIAQMLDLVQLSDYGKRKPHSLSGGQAQRIALARALAPDPQIMLLDEPLSALDVQLRQELAAQLRQLLREKTSIFVTHDPQEAAAVADRVVRLEELTANA